MQHEINFISLSAIPPSQTADFVVIELQTEFGKCEMIMQASDYHRLCSTDFFQNKYVSFKDEHFQQKKTA